MQMPIKSFKNPLRKKTQIHFRERIQLRAIFGNALGVSRTVGLGLAPKEKIGD
ncbi:hypothetical protein YC2023_031256 [Brassica napus]